METPGGPVGHTLLAANDRKSGRMGTPEPLTFHRDLGGRDDIDAVKFWPDQASKACWVTSHFGLGILTWHVPYPFRSPGG